MNSQQPKIKSINEEDNMSEIIFEKLTVNDQERLRGGNEPPPPAPDYLSCTDERPDKPCT
jgi:hypothetical protein